MAETTVALVPADGAPSADIFDSPGIKIFAGNLDYSVTSDDLKTFFALIESDILSCQVILRGTRSAGYGFVAAATDDAAKKAIDALNGQDFQGRKAIVELAKPAEEKEKERSVRKARNRNGRRGTKAVPGEVTEAEANGEADKPATTADTEGKPKKKKKNARKNKARDAVTPAEDGASAEAGGEAAAALAAEGEKKKTPKPKRAPRPRRPAGEEPTGEESTTTLFVANLPFTLDDAGLGAIFTDAGFKVNSARVVRRRWGHPRRSKGYGFVDVGEEQQKKAMEALQGKELEGGRQIAVKIAVNPTHEDGSDAEKGAEEGKSEALATDAPALALEMGASVVA